MHHDMENEISESMKIKLVEMISSFHIIQNYNKWEHGNISTMKTNIKGCHPA